MCIRMPVPTGSYVDINADVIAADVPFLLGIGLLDREQTVADIVNTRLKCRLQGWSLPTIRRTYMGAGT